MKSQDWGSSRKMGINVGILSNPLQRNGADRREERSIPAHGPRNVNFGILMMSQGTSKMLLPSERQGVSTNPRHAGEDMALTAHVKASFEEAEGGIYPCFRLRSFSFKSVRVVSRESIGNAVDCAANCIARDI